VKAIQYLILRFVLFLVFALITSPIPVASIWLVEYFDAHGPFPILKGILILVLLAWLFGLPWLTSQAAQHMAFEDQTLDAAVKLTFYDLRFRLAFLPLVGHWFEPPKGRRDIDEEDD
jgi:hypothetical protein